jgi:parallel beta-helix repeat protein
MIFISLTSTGLSATYYVSTTGNDSISGDIHNPWKSIQKAANTVLPGDNVIVTSGIYNERVNISRSGSSITMITFSANGNVNIQGFVLNGSFIKIEGFTISPPAGQGVLPAVSISGTYNIVKSCTMSDIPGPGVNLVTGSANCTIQYNTIVRAWINGISVTNGTNHLVEYNDISDSRCSMKGQSWADANGVDFHGSGHIFRGNYIHDIYTANNPGYSPHIDGFQTYVATGKPAATNCIFEKNRVFLMQNAISVEDTTCAWMLEYANGIIIRNNITFVYSGVNTGGGGNSNLIIVDNTFINDITKNTKYWPMGIVITNVSNCKVKNNIFYDNYYKAWDLKGSNPGLDIDYNCIYRSDGKTLSEERKPHDVWNANPMFRDVKQSDYHLQSNSPCIDTGTSLSEVTDDYEDNPRPQGAGVDIGAIEYIVLGSEVKNLRVK